MLELKVTNQEIKVIQSTPYGEPLVSGSSGEYECHFQFDETWNGFIKTAVFEIMQNPFSCRNENVGDARILVDDKCLIPASVLKPNSRIRIGVIGVKGDITRPTIYTSPRLVRQGADVGEVPEIDNNLYLQLIELIDKVGVPMGGKQGQVLAKKTDNDYDTYWADQTGGGGTITAVGEGDMIIITTSLPVRGEGDTIIIG